MKNSFKKYLIGLSVLVVMVSLSCSKRESSGEASPGSASYSQADSALKNLGMALTFPTMAQFSSGDTSGVTALFSAGGAGDLNKYSTFDTTKFADLDNAIGSMQDALGTYSSAPKAKGPSLSPSLIAGSEWKNPDLAFIHLYLGYLYTLNAAIRVRRFVAESVIIINGARYNFDLTGQELNTMEIKGIRAILDAYLLLSGNKKKVIRGSETIRVTPGVAIVAGYHKNAAWHLDQAITYGGYAFPDLGKALSKLKADSFTAFFNDPVNGLEKKIDNFFGDTLKDDI